LVPKRSAKLLIENQCDCKLYSQKSRELRLAGIAGMLLCHPASALEVNQNLSPFPKWTRVVLEVGMVHPSSHDVTLDALQRTHAMQRFLRYTPDGPKDYWKTPQEFWRDGGGDCEDFAIAAYYTLLRKGFHDSDLHIALGVKRRTQEMHAVLVVNLYGNVYVLDNEASEIMPAGYLRRMEIAYRINRLGWWR
jgi:hypothetical protein